MNLMDLQNNQSDSFESFVLSVYTGNFLSYWGFSNGVFVLGSDLLLGLYLIFVYSVLSFTTRLNLMWLLGMESHFVYVGVFGELSLCYVIYFWWVVELEKDGYLLWLVNMISSFFFRIFDWLIYGGRFFYLGGNPVLWWVFFFRTKVFFVFESSLDSEFLNNFLFSYSPNLISFGVELISSFVSLQNSSGLLVCFLIFFGSLCLSSSKGFYDYFCYYLDICWLCVRNCIKGFCFLKYSIIGLSIFNLVPLSLSDFSLKYMFQFCVLVVLFLLKLVIFVFLVGIIFFYSNWLVEVIWSFYKSFSSKGSFVTQSTICSMFGGIVVMVDCSIVFGLWESFVVVMIWCLVLFCRFVSFLVMLASILFYQNMVIKMLKEYYKNHPNESKFYYIMWVCLVSLNCFIIIVLFFFFL